MKTKTFKTLIPASLIAFSTVASAKEWPTLRQNTTTQTIATSSYDLSSLETRIASLIAPAEQDHVREVTRFFSLALQAWNPSLNPNDVERIIEDHIERQGLMRGLIEPTIALIDVSYAAGRPQFGNLLNPMLREVAPSLAESLHNRYQLPLDYQGRSFQNFTRLNDNDISSKMQSLLGQAFYDATKSNSPLDPRTDFMSQAILGPTSFVGFTAGNLVPNKMHAEESSPEPRRSMIAGGNSNNSTPRSQTDDERERPKGIFSKLDLVSMTGACVAKCSADVFTGAINGLSAPGGLYAKLVVAAVAVTAAGVSCYYSSECQNPDPNKTAPQKKDPIPQPPTPKKEEPPQSTSPKQDPPPQKEPEDRNPGTPETPNAPATSTNDNPQPEPSTPKEPDDSTDGTDDGDHNNTELKTSGIILTRFSQDEEDKMRGFDLSKLQKKFDGISTPMKGN